MTVQCWPSWPFVLVQSDKGREKRRRRGGRSAVGGGGGGPEGRAFDTTARPSTPNHPSLTPSTSTNTPPLPPSHLSYPTHSTHVGPATPTHLSHIHTNNQQTKHFFSDFFYQLTPKSYILKSSYQTKQKTYFLTLFKPTQWTIEIFKWIPTWYTNIPIYIYQNIYQYTNIHISIKMFYPYCIGFVMCGRRLPARIDLIYWYQMEGIKQNEGRSGVISFDIFVCLDSILFNISDYKILPHFWPSMVSAQTDFIANFNKMRQLRLRWYAINIS